MGEHFFAGVAQLVEQLIRNQQVSGSSPLAGFRLKIKELSPSDRTAAPDNLKTLDDVYGVESRSGCPPCLSNMPCHPTFSKF